MRKSETQKGAERFVPPGRNIGELQAAAASCKGCELWKNATQTVFGAGSERASIMLIGEQPGDQEDVKGVPFSGPAGRLLDRGLIEAGIRREEVYITNAVKTFQVAATREAKTSSEAK